MIGDPLYDAIAKRRDKKRAQRPPESPRPEGVALYRCIRLIPSEEHEDEVRQCGARAEAKPYAPIPRHCDAQMVIVGYDWNRDCD